MILDLDTVLSRRPVSALCLDLRSRPISSWPARAARGSREEKRAILDEAEYHHRVDLVCGASPWPDAIAALSLATRGLG